MRITHKMKSSHRPLSTFLLILSCLFSLSKCDQLHRSKASSILIKSNFNLQTDELLGLINDDDGHQTKNKYKGHKDLIPLNASDILAFTLEALALLVAAGGGIGGGGILVPLYTLILRFRPKHAISLSNVSVLGGAIANVLLNISKRHPLANRPLIDWDLVLMMQPPIIAGALIGAILNKLLPEFVLVVMLVIILSITAYKTLTKWRRLYERENEEIQTRHQTLNEKLTSTYGTIESLPVLDKTIHQDQPESNMTDTESEVSVSTPLLEEEQAVDNNMSVHPFSEINSDQSNRFLLNEILKSERRTPIVNVLAIILLFVVVIALNILKGGGAESSPLGIQCGSLGFWLIQGLMFVWIITVTLIARQYLLKRTELKTEANYQFKDGDIVWDNKATIAYPLLCGIAGLCAGMFGIGGGIIIGPIMLALDVHPMVVAATSATMNLFTSFTVTTSYIVFGLLTYDYAFVVAIIAFVATIAGQLIMDALLKKNGRYSHISLIIGCTVLISAILMAIQARFPVIETNQRQETGRICSKDV